MADRLHFRDARWRVYRRVIEIRDARLSLRGPLRAARWRARRKLAASGTTPEPAQVEGYALAETVAATAPADEPPTSGVDTEGVRTLPPERHEKVDLDDVPQDPAGADLAAEVTYLSAVSEHYVHAVAHSSHARQPILPQGAAEDAVAHSKKDPS